MPLCRDHWEVLLVAAGTLSLITYGVGTASFQLPKWILLFVGIALFCFGVLIPWLRSDRIALDGVDFRVILVLLYICLSIAWSPDPGAGAIEACHFTILAIIFMVVRRVPTQRLLPLVSCISVLATIVVLFRTVALPAVEGGFGNENFLTEFLLLVLPFLGAWAVVGSRWWRWAGIVLATTVLVHLVCVNASRIEYAALPFLFATAATSYVRRRRGWSIAALSLAGLIVATGVAIASQWNSAALDVSVHARMEFAVNTLFMLAERPWFGHGLGSFDYAYPRFQQRHLGVLPGDQYTALSSTLSYAGAAHNEFLQALAQFGVAGSAAMLYLASAVLRCSPPGVDRTATAAARACLILATVCAAIGFPLQNPATATMVVFALAILLPIHPDAATLRITNLSANARSSVKVVASAAVIALVASGSSFFGHAVVGQRHHARALQLLKSDPAGAFAASERAYNVFPLDPTFRRQLFASAVGWLERSSDSTRPMPLDFDRLYAISRSAGPQLPGLLLARTHYLIVSNRDRDDPAAIEELFAALKSVSPNLPDIYIVEAFYASRLRNWNRARAAIGTARRYWESYPAPLRRHDQLERIVQIENIVPE